MINNPYLVCSDRELRALPTQWLLAERWDKAGRLLDDLAFMEATVRRLGIDELLHEYASALRLLPEDEAWRSKLESANRALDRQAHHLRDWDSRAQPAFFLQQLRNESFQLDLGELQARTEVKLAEQLLPHFSCKFREVRESPELVRTLQGHREAVCGVALSEDGRLAVSVSWDKTLKVWDVASGRELRTLTGHSRLVYGVALSPDGQLAVSASADQTLKVWDVAKGCELRTLTGHSGDVRGVAFGEGSSAE